MTKREFEAIVKESLAKLPKKFRERLQNIDVVIEERVDRETMKKLELAGPDELEGLYQGIPLGERTHGYGEVMPDKITLYRRAIERECNERGLDVRTEVRNVVEHEIAHHFGISDERMEDLDVY